MRPWLHPHTDPRGARVLPGYRPACVHGTQRGGQYETPSARRRFCRGALARVAVAEVS